MLDEGKWKIDIGGSEEGGGGVGCKEEGEGELIIALPSYQSPPSSCTLSFYHTKLEET